MKITPIDTNLAEDGAWFSYHGVKLLIARAGNETFKKYFRRLTKPHKHDIENENLDDKIATEIFCEAMAQGILLGWDSSTAPGNLEYSKEEAKQLLIEDPDCRNFIMETARNIENFFVQDKEETLGN